VGRTEDAVSVPLLLDTLADHAHIRVRLQVVRLTEAVGAHQLIEAGEAIARRKAYGPRPRALPVRVRKAITEWGRVVASHQETHVFLYIYRKISLQVGLDVGWKVVWEVIWKISSKVVAIVCGGERQRLEGRSVGVGVSVGLLLLLGAEVLSVGVDVRLLLLRSVGVCISVAIMLLLPSVCE